jgi:hypothetical protein
MGEKMTAHQALCMLRELDPKSECLNITCEHLLLIVDAFDEMKSQLARKDKVVEAARELMTFIDTNKLWLIMRYKQELRQALAEHDKGE